MLAFFAAMKYCSSYDGAGRSWAIQAEEIYPFSASSCPSLTTVTWLEVTDRREVCRFFRARIHALGLPAWSACVGGFPSFGHCPVSRCGIFSSLYSRPVCIIYIFQCLEALSIHMDQKGLAVCLRFLLLDNRPVFYGNPGALKMQSLNEHGDLRELNTCDRSCEDLLVE